MDSIWINPGKVKTSMMMDFENAALNFFISKPVPAEKQVTMIILSIKDLHIRDWIAAECDCIVALIFAAFMVELHLNYLPQDWEDQVHNDILTSTLATSSTSFWNWSQQILKLNCLLCGTSSIFDEPTLQNHLKVHLDDELKAQVRHNEVCKDKKFKTWVAAVCLLDKAHTIETKCQCELIEETLQCQAKRQNTNSGPSHCGNSSNTTSSSSSTYVHLPALSDTERTFSVFKSS